MSQYEINTTCLRSGTTILVTGQVFDANSNETLPFANVYLSHDSTIGTATDINGEFRLEVPKASTVVVSFVGYHPFRFDANGLHAEIFLTPDDQLETVEIIGTNKKKNYNWLWWLLIGGGVLKAASNSSEKKTPALGKPMDVKI